MTGFVYRVMGALALDSSVYEYVETRRSSTPAAFLVVVASGLAAGVGAAGLAGPRLMTLALVAGTALAMWLAWAGLILYVGGLILPERQTRVNYGELVRTIGFAASPGMFQVFALFTAIAVPVFVLSWLWMFAAMVIAVRQALDFQSSWRAVGVCLVTLSVVLVTTVVMGMLLQVRVA